MEVVGKEPRSLIMEETYSLVCLGVLEVYNCCSDTSSEFVIFINIPQGEESGTNGGNGYSGGGCGGTGGQPGDQLLPILSRWRSKPPTRWSWWAGWWGRGAFTFLWRWWSGQWGGLPPFPLDDVLVRPINHDLLLSRWTSRSSP